jgi:hypothetical protein
MARKYSQKVIDEVEEARKDISEGRVYTEEEVLRMFAGKTDAEIISDFDNLTPEEQEIENELERGDCVLRPATPEEKAELAAIARYTLKRRKDIS